ncbi:MAG: hypothetical protein LBH75_01995 [Treponema sp.]|jgi:hypothetical protein|nr:hypothetical protein [Treponema sp.]
MKKLLLFAVVVLCLNGCVSVNADIAMKSDGSGVLTLEYRILESLYRLGELDGNEMRPPIPVSKMDFERSVNRIDGLRLISFSAKTEAGRAPQDENAQVVVAVKLKFSTLDALIRFLSGTGQRVVYSQENGNNKLLMVLWGEWEIDPDLNSLAVAVLEGYHFSLRFSIPKGTAQFRLISTDGVKLDLGVVGAGHVTIPMSTLIAEKNGVQMEILW